MKSSISEAKACYEKAVQIGKKQGGSPKILDDILMQLGLKTPTEYPLGLQDISLDQIAGTKTEGRKNCFSKGLYPLLSSDTEFAAKWISLCKSHLDEGIHDPIKVYEYMNRFYVIEGNKRASILKFFDSVTIPADVIRIMPPQIDRPDIILYYEFVDFYNLSHINYVYFTKSGSFIKLHRLTGKKRNEPWTDEDRLNFNSVFTRFRQEYTKLMGEKDYVLVSDAFLTMISVIDYSSLIDLPFKEFHQIIIKWKEEFLLGLSGESTDVKMNPSEKKTNPILQLVPKTIVPKSMTKLNVAFIHDKSAERSGWTFNHDAGRQSLEKAFPENVKTTVYNNTDLKNIDQALEDAIIKKHQVIFTTSPIFLKATLQAAINHPEIKFLNCTTHLSYRHVRTYYARMYEVKFLMGAIAGAMSENNKIGYIADYPIYGTVSNINAFALGAKMINPKAEIHLRWSKQQRTSDGVSQNISDIYDYYRKEQIAIICDKDSLGAGEYSQRLGLYREDPSGIWNMALPVWDWSRFYEITIGNILNGTWKTEDTNNKSKGINYWWGLSSGIIDLIYSGRLPIGTTRLIELLKNAIVKGEFNPFTGLLFSQERVVQTDRNAILSPEQILTMDWLAENIAGSIPARNELTESAQILSSFLGVDQGEHVL